MLADNEQASLLPVPQVEQVRTEVAASLSLVVPSDSDPEVRAHFRFDRIICSNLANNAAGETSPLVAERPSRRRRFERYRIVVLSTSLRKSPCD